MARKQAATHFALPGGDREIVTSSGKKLTAEQFNRFRWQTGMGIAPVRLYPHQIPLYHAILDTPALARRPIVCSRRFGKTMTVLSAIEEIARRKIGSVRGEPVIIRLAFPQKSQAQTVVIPNWNIVLDTCPPDLRPTQVTDGMWQWPNGSQLHLIGTDDADQRERHRGGMAHWIFLDEAGSQKDFEYLVNSILSPQLDTTDGRMVMITTPPVSMEHGFVPFWRRGEEKGIAVTRTVFHNTTYSGEKLRALCEERNPGFSGGQIDAILAAGDSLKPGDASPTWEREYLCRMVADLSVRATPRFVESRHVAERPASPYRKRYVFIDQGHAHDFFAGILASHDLRDGVLYVEDEYLERRVTTDRIVDALRRKEEALWRGAGPVSRIANDPRGHQQLADMHARGFSVSMGKKSDGAETEANLLDVKIAEGKVVIHPRCVKLIKQLREGIMDVSGSGAKMDYLRTEDMGHLDALAALAMGVRHVDWTAKPQGLAVDDANAFFNEAVQALQKQNTRAARIARSIFGA